MSMLPSLRATRSSPLHDRAPRREFAARIAMATGGAPRLPSGAAKETYSPPAFNRHAVTLPSARPITIVFEVAKRREVTVLEPPWVPKSEESVRLECDACKGMQCDTVQFTSYSREAHQNSVARAQRSPLSPFLRFPHRRRENHPHQHFRVSPTNSTMTTRWTMTTRRQPQAQRRLQAENRPHRATRRCQTC